MKGYLVTSKVEGFSGRSIFIPAAGYIDNTRKVNDGVCGYYWSNAIYQSNSKHAISTVFDGHIMIRYLPDYRYLGLTIRPVCD
ncbi:MAG: hypothetical protein J6T18_04790 [Bacteroidaceae bacterium]|nr:hypothetical protein [Bacteroidaceae bacterium]